MKIQDHQLHCSANPQFCTELVPLADYSEAVERFMNMGKAELDFILIVQ